MTRSSALVWAVEQALHAPSVHNTQPWRWRIGADTVELHADFTRHLPWTDPDRRDLVLSCGAAVHHLRVALAFRNLAPTIQRLPAATGESDNEALMAVVTIGAAPGDAEEAALFPAITRRHTDRVSSATAPSPSTCSISSPTGRAERTRT